MKTYTKRKFPVDKVRRFLEPGPIVMVSSSWKGERNIMTMGWYAMMRYDMVGCYIWDANYSFQLIMKSEECCINIPEVHLLDTTVRVGNSDGDEVDKFAEFNLTPQKATKVAAPLIKECYANFECKVIDTRMVKEYSFFVLQVVAARVAVSPKFPKTFHYTGDGVFMLSGNHANRSKLFDPQILKC